MGVKTSEGEAGTAARAKSQTPRELCCTKSFAQAHHNLNELSRELIKLPGFSMTWGRGIFLWVLLSKGGDMVKETEDCVGKTKQNKTQGLYEGSAKETLSADKL